MTFKQLMTKPAEFTAFIIKQNGKLIKKTETTHENICVYVFKHRRVTITTRVNSMRVATSKITLKTEA